MTNIEEHCMQPNAASAWLFNKPLLTPTEAAQFLGISRRKLGALNIRKRVLDRQNSWYLQAELVEWVSKLPQFGEMPTEELHTIAIHFCE